MPETTEEFVFFRLFRREGVEDTIATVDSWRQTNKRFPPATTSC